MTDLEERMLAQLKANHLVMDGLMATLIWATRNDKAPFMPTQSSAWPVVVANNLLIQEVESGRSPRKH